MTSDRVGKRKNKLLTRFMLQRGAFIAEVMWCRISGEKINLKVKDMVGNLYTVEPPLPIGENKVPMLQKVTI